MVRISVWSGAILAAMEIGFAQIGYVESSGGFRDNPVLEGGRTELEFADIDDDGNIDIVCIGDHGSPYINTDEHGVMVWFGDGRGNWTLFQYGDFGYGGVAVGDANNDGKWDVGYGMHHNYSGVDLGDDMLEVALGDGTGRMWTAWDDSLVPGGSVWGLFSTDFADVDNDGDLDVGSTSFGYGIGARVFLNNGNGTWHESFRTPGQANNRIEFYFRDINRDGNADFITASAGHAVYFGDGTGGFVLCDTGLPVSSNGLAGISPGDVDNDGGCDIAFVNSTGGVVVYVWNEHARTWQNFSGNLPAVDSFYATQLCDMNIDGAVDLVALRHGYIQIWAGDAQGNWTPLAQIQMTRPNGYSALRAGADFDHNGYPDLAVVSREGNWPNDRNVAHAYRETSPVDSLRVFPAFPRGGERFEAGSVQFVDWWSEAPGFDSTRVRLELSVSGAGGPWELIADSLRNAGRYQWSVPRGIVAGDCYIRYTVSGPAGTAQTVTPRAFSIGAPVGAAEALGGQEPSRLTRVVRQGLRLPKLPTRHYSLHAADGRRVRELTLGNNDISGLEAGVYFLYAASQAGYRAKITDRIVVLK